MNVALTFKGDSFSMKVETIAHNVLKLGVDKFTIISAAMIVGVPLLLTKCDVFKEEKQKNKQTVNY